MIHEIDFFLTNYIFSFLFNNDKCMNSITPKQPFCSCLLISKSVYNKFKKPCDMFFVYKPYSSRLSKISECLNHCNKDNNKIYIINLLNNLKNKIKKKKLYINGELIFKTRADCEFVSPYLKDLKLQTYDRFTNNGIYIIHKGERFNTFI